MTPASLDVISTPKQAWNLLREKYDLRLSQIHSEMIEELQEAREKIRSENAKGQNYSDYCKNRIQVESKHANDWAEKCYQLCCEIWEEDGHQKCSAFYGAIYRYCLLPIFRGHASAVTSELKREGSMSGEKGRSNGAIRTFVEDMDCLRHEWKIGFDIESLGGKHRKPRERETKIGHDIPAATTTTSPIIEPTKTIPKQRIKPLTPTQRKRASVILGAIQLGLKGQKYCHELDTKKLPIRQEWIADSCPNNYPTAYGDLKWRKRIHDEKHRMQVKIDKFGGANRPGILEKLARPTR
jgi:hypothetical protein